MSRASGRQWGGQRRRPELGLLVVAAPLLFPLQSVLFRTQGERATVLTTLPPEKLLPALSVGQEPALARLLEIRSTNYLFDPERLVPGARMNESELERFYRAITILDPQDADAYVRGAIFLSTVADRVDVAVELLHEGLDRVDPDHPRRAAILQELAATHLTILAAQAEDEAERLGHVRRAGEWLAEVARLPQTPAEQRTAFLELGHRLAQRGLSELDGLSREIEHWQDVAAGASEEGLKERALARAQEAESGLRRLTLAQALAAYRQQRGRSPTALADLAVGNPRVQLEDPLGFGFYLSEAYGLPPGQVVAPAYEARREQRRFLVRWREAGGPEADDPQAALAELEESARLPPYLHVELAKSPASEALEPRITPRAP